MRTYRLNAKTRQIRKARYTTRHVQKESLPTNLLNRQFSAGQPCEKLLTDMTYIPYYKKGQWHWGYLSLVMDTLGAPADLSRFVLNGLISGVNGFNRLTSLLDSADVPLLPKPILGSEWIADRFRNNTPWQDNPGSAGDIVGDVAGMAIPFMLGGGVLNASKIGRSNVAEFVSDAWDRLRGTNSNLSTEQLLSIKNQLDLLQKGYSPRKTAIDNLMTPAQFKEYQKQRASAGMMAPSINQFSINYPHIRKERIWEDDYSVSDIYEQIKSVTSKKSNVLTDADGRVNLRNPNARNDGYGNYVNDTLGFGRKDRPLIQTVYPEGDGKKNLPRKKNKGLLEKE